ncbi:MAG TPA: glycosyltransferase family 4 protein, partial [Longimicrobiales bacterium]|nr:glycosyltransferase family 4 protein [Longimicrobiales bacterium]
EPRLPGVAFERVRWSAEREAEVLASLDVGLYPLDDTPWTRGKCGFKALQYLSCGVPCVASPVGVLRDIVRPGVTGLHAGDPEGWAAALARLLGDAAERRRMGEAGRALVEEGYSVERVAPLVAEAIETAVRGPRAPEAGGMP